MIDDSNYLTVSIWTHLITFCVCQLCIILVAIFSNNLISILFGTILNIIFGCLGLWFILFFSIYCWRKYKKTFWKFGKLTRLISHFVNVGIFVQIMIIMSITIGFSPWNGNDSLHSYFHSSAFIASLTIGLFVGIYAICGLVINWKKVKRRKLWYLFTKTDTKTIDKEELDDTSLI
jgi:hypothetical protein